MEGEPSSPPPRPGPSFDDLLERTRAFATRLADDYVKKPLDRLFRWSLGRGLSYLVAGALFVTAAVFLMIGGVEALKTASVPPYVAYVTLGVVGVLAGVAILWATRPPEAK